MESISPFNEFIQVAGVIDRAELKLLMDCGVDFLGFPLRLPVNTEDLTELEASKIIRSLVLPHRAIVITYQNDARSIAEFMSFLGADIVQLHGDISFDQISRLKKMRPELIIIKSLVVGQHADDVLTDMVRVLSSVVDAFIMDTMDSKTGACGATGKLHDWGISRRLVEVSARPVILAGGLNPENVRDAILEVSPAGVDVHSGVEAASGRKDRYKVKTFVEEAKSAFAALRGQ